MPRDLAALPEDVRAVARVDANGEVSWPDSHAAAAINSLADAGAVVLGLDVRLYAADGRFYEVAWSSFEPDISKAVTVIANDARDAALRRLASINELEAPVDTVERRVLITWR